MNVGRPVLRSALICGCFGRAELVPDKAIVFWAVCLNTNPKRARRTLGMPRSRFGLV